MPFTFSHPAAVLPVHSRLKDWIPLSALVIGSLLPDAAYYLPMPEHFRQTSHTLLGTFSSSLPLGILVWLMFYWLAAPTVFLLPAPHREAIEPWLTRPLISIPQALGVVSGILLGAWTHVLWDSFTHQRGWMLWHIPLLRRELFGSTLPVYKALQYISSVLGLWVLLYVYNKWIRASGFQLWIWRRPTWRFYLWLGVAVICLVAAGIEGHGITAMANLFFRHGGHLALELFTIFVRDFLIALCAVAIGAKVLGLGSSREPQPEMLAKASAPANKSDATFSDAIANSQINAFKRDRPNVSGSEPEGSTPH